MILAALASAAVASGTVPPAVAADQPRTANAARTIRLTPRQMLSLAEQATQRGDRETASRIYGALSSNANREIRSEARFLRAKILASSGKPSAAAVLLRQVLDEVPGATPVRLELAQLLQQLGDADGALRELRSAQASGLPPDVARLVDRYSQAIRANRPSGVSLEFALAPDSNINRATRSDTLGTVIGDFEIDEDSKAKSGTGVAVRGHAYRRFALPMNGATFLTRVSASSDWYREADYRDLAVDVAVGPEFQLGPARLTLEAGATRRWFGQKPFLRSTRLGGTASLPLGSRSRARVSASATRLDNRLNDLQDGTAYVARVDVEHALNATTGIAANASYDRQSLADPGYSTKGFRAGLTGWRDLGRSTVTLGASYGRLAADQRLILFPRKREDRYFSLSLAATFRQLSVAGFAPLIRLTTERNRSTVEFYDYRRTRTELGVVRAF